MGGDLQTLETEVYYDSATNQYRTRLKVPENLAQWEKELLYGDAMEDGAFAGCSCAECERKRGNRGGSAPKPTCPSCKTHKSEIADLKAKVAAMEKKNSDLDAEAAALAKELEQAMTDRDELLDVLRWYERTE